MQITGGRVCYSRTVSPAPYESAKAETELSFIVEEGDNIDDVTAECLDICKEQVHHTIGLRKIS